MRRRSRLKLITLSVLTILAVASQSLPTYVGAQASNINAAEGLQISPAIVELNADPGGSYKIDLQVTNVTASDLAFDTDVNDFAARDESGTPSVNLENDTPNAASISAWVTVLQTLNIAARQTKKVTATIDVPLDAEPGGHYGVIRFSGRAPELESSGVGLAASAGTLVLVRVAGAVDEDLDLVTFQTAQDGKSGSFFEYGPLDFILRFENRGNVHVKPTGQIEVRDMFGNHFDTLTVNQDKGNVLPLSIRKFQTTLDKQWLFGRYTADVSVGYGTTGQAIVRTISFWVIPWKIIAIALLVIVTAFFVLRTLIRRYNNYIIKRASASHSDKGHHDQKKKKRKK